MIAIKPHHFIDIITALGDGRTDPQPHPYGHAVHTVTRQILANHAVDLLMEFGADDICRPCRHNLDGLCDDTIDVSDLPGAPTSKREYNLLIDQRWAARLGLRPGDVLTARDFCRRLRDQVDDLTDIYRETPPDQIAERQARLQKGIAQFLDFTGRAPTGKARDAGAIEAQ